MERKRREGGGGGKKEANALLMIRFVRGVVRIWQYLASGHDSAQLHRCLPTRTTLLALQQIRTLDPAPLKKPYRAWSTPARPDSRLPFHRSNPILEHHSFLSAPWLLCVLPNCHVHSLLHASSAMRSVIDSSVHSKVFSLVLHHV